MNLQDQQQRTLCILVLSLTSLYHILNATTFESVKRKCSSPLLPLNAKISEVDVTRKYPINYDRGHGVNEYHEHDLVSFICKQGYIRIGALPFFNKMEATCGSDGKWFPKISELGQCVSAKSLDKCESENLFKCKTGGKCISKEKLCDCQGDCDDSSDEIDCKIRRKVIWATSNGKFSNGIITSVGYPRGAEYPTSPKHYNCIYHIYTLLDHHIQVDFEEFDLPKKENKKCLDFVRIMAIHPEFIRQRKRKRNDRKKYRTKKRRTSQTKCGNNMFRRIYSNSSHITINVSLGYTSEYHKGFSLTWQVRNKRNFYKALHQELEERKNNNIVVSNSNNNGDDDDDTYNIVLPIALAGLLPLMLVIFCLFYRIIRRRYFAAKNKPTNKDDKNNMTMTLTQNNLARFDEQNRTRTPEAEPNQGLVKTPTTNSRMLPPPEGNSNVSIENTTFQPPNCTNNKPHKEIRDSNGSQHSDLPRYIMSYDMPLKHSPTPFTRQSSHSSHRLSSNSHGRSNSPRPNTCSRNSSPCFNNHHQQQQLQQQQVQRTRHSKYSRENMHSSCSSQSTNTCSLCHQRRSMCNNQNYLYQHSSTTSHPLNLNTEMSHPLNLNTEMYQMNCEYDDEHTYTPTNFPQNTYTSCDANEGRLSDQDLYNTNDAYPFNTSNYHRKDLISYSYSSMNIYPPVTYSESELVDTALIQPSLHQVEKHKIYDTERFIVANDELYGQYALSTTDRTRGGSLICTH